MAHDLAKLPAARRVGTSSSRRARSLAAAATIAGLLCALATTSVAPSTLAQPKPASPAPPIVPPTTNKKPAGLPPPVAPPSTGTDLEVDPDAPKEPEPPPPEPPPLPPADPDAWGTGGKEEEGKFAPQGKTGSLKDEDQAKKDAEDNKGPVDLGLPGFGWIDMVVGFGEINNAMADAATGTKATVFSFVFGATYRAWDIWTMGVRFPYSTGEILGPKEDTIDDFKTFAIGNFELSVSPSFQLTRKLRIAPSVALALPSAAGDLFAAADERGSVGQALINQAVSQSRGWEDNGLFASKRFVFTPAAGVTYDSNALHITGKMKLDVIAKTGGNDPKPEIEDQKNIVLHDPNTTFMIQGSLFYDFLDGKVSPGLRTWLSVHQEAISSQTATGGRDYSGAQFVLEPTVTGRFPITESGKLAIRAGLSYIINVAGPLGNGDNGTTIGGLRMKAGLQF